VELLMAERTKEEIDAILARIQEETDALPAHSLPGFFSWAAGHPGIVNYRTKNAEKYDADMRRAHFLERAESEVGPARTWGNYGLGTLAGLTTSENMKNLRSAYEPYASEGQVLGEDHPVYNVSQWMQSMPSTAYATGQMLANEVRPAGDPHHVDLYPDSYKAYAKSMNTLGLGIPGKLGLLPDESRWKDLQGMREEMARPPGDQPAWRTLDPRMWEAAVQASRPSDMIEGREFLKDAGVSEQYANFAGDFMDATLDPFNNIAPALKMARVGQASKAAKALALDYGLGTAGTTVPAGIDAVQQIREFLNRRNR